MLVEKVLARPFKNLDVSAAQQLLVELDEVRSALETVRCLADEDETGVLSKRFAQWHSQVTERRTQMKAIYPTVPEMYEVYSKAIERMVEDEYETLDFIAFEEFCSDLCDLRDEIEHDIEISADQRSRLSYRVNALVRDVVRSGPPVC